MGERGSSTVVNLSLIALLVGIGVVAYLILGGSGGAEAEGQAVTTTVSRGSVRATVSASGTIESSETVGASFTSSGTVTDLYVEVGERVRKGELLARVDDSSSQTEITVASASVDSAQAGLESARANLASARETLRELRHSDASAGEVAQAEAQVASARAQIDQAAATMTSATAQLGEAQETASDAELRAPIAGTVIEVSGSVGQTATTGEGAGDSTTSGETTSDGTSGSGSDASGFIVISDLGDLEIRAYFSETDTAQLAVGQRAQVTLNATPGEALTGRVVAIDETSTTVNQVVSYGVTIELNDQPADVRVGQTVVAVVVTDRASDVLVVPSGAVQTAEDQSTVTVMRNGEQVTVPVEVGLEGDQQTEIVSGLSEGERVVIPSASGFGEGGGFPGGGFPGINVGGPGGPGAGP